MTPAPLDRDREWCRRRAGQERRLDQDHVLEVASLAQELHIVDGRGGEILVLQPDAHEGVAHRQDEDGMKSCLLKRRCIKKRRIEAGPDLALEHLGRTAHLLPGALEARGRQHIGETPLRKRGPERLRHLPDAGLGVSSIAVQGAVASRGGELRGGVAQHDVDGRLVGPHEGREQFGRGSTAAPVRRRQQPEFRDASCADVAGRLGPDRQLERARLGEPCERRGIEVQVRRVQTMKLARADPIDAEGRRTHDRRVRCDHQDDVDDLSVGRVLDDDLPDERNRILMVGETYMLGGRTRNDKSIQQSPALPGQPRSCTEVAQACPPSTCTAEVGHRQLQEATAFVVVFRLVAEWRTGRNRSANAYVIQIAR